MADSKSQSFIETISQMVQVSSLDNYVEFIREGSTNVGGTISANSQSGASGIQSSLGNSVPGYTVLSSSASVYYGD